MTEGRVDPAWRLLYRREPDYTRPGLEVDETTRARLLELLGVLYGRDTATEWIDEVVRVMRVFHAHKTPEIIAADAEIDPSERFTHEDVILITYGDLILSPDDRPLEVLADVLERYVRNINTVHLLPFFPYSSDRGFAVIDYHTVDPRIGRWADVERMAKRFRVMFDGVFNHVSSKSRWFQEYLNGHPYFQDFFIDFSTHHEVSQDHRRLILRPRASDLLTAFHTIGGVRHVWTTFSDDHIDLNYKNPRVLVQMLEVLLYYVRRGADLVRLDAATYLWYELGTNCAHLVQTHALIKLFRAVLDVVAPRIALVTETNVLHRDNVSYFGDGRDEAQMVYNFALPPLVLHTFYSGDCTRLTDWARGLEHVSDTATYFNFLDSHDGIGLLPVSEILDSDEIEAMIARAQEHGALVSYRTDGEGNRIPYEINVTWWSALNREGHGREGRRRRLNRFIASRAVAMVLRGVPGIYIASMIGNRNDRKAVEDTGEARRINRPVINAERLLAMLDTPTSRASQIARRMDHLLNVRIRTPAFHPNADQQVLDLPSSVFAVRRRNRSPESLVVALINITDDEVGLRVPASELGSQARRWSDLLSSRDAKVVDATLELALAPYEVVWLSPVR